MTIGTLLQKALGRRSDDHAESLVATVAEQGDIALRPDLMIRWDDENAATNTSTCDRVPSRRARRTSSPVFS